MRWRYVALGGLIAALAGCGRIGYAPRASVAVDGGDGGGVRVLFSVGGAGAARARDIAIDPSGRVVASGTFTGALSFGATTATSSGSQSGFVAASEADGTARWLSPILGDEWVEPRDVAIDASGTSFVTGHALGPARFDTVEVTGFTYQYAFVIARDVAGTLAWWHAYGGGANRQAHDAQWDPAGARLLISGFYLEDTRPADFAGLTLPQAANDQGFLLSAGATGVMQWARRFQSDGHASADSLDVLGARICVAGRFAVAMDLDESGAPELTSAGSNYDGFVAALAPDGTLAWSRSFGGALHDQGVGVVVAGDDCIVLVRADTTTPFEQSGITLSRYGAASPSPIWSVAYAGTVTMIPTSLARDARGGVYVGGSFVESPWTPVAGIAITPSGGRDGFVAKHDASSGAVEWVVPLGSPGDDSVEGVAVDPAGSAVALATLGGSATLGGAEIVVDGASDVAAIAIDR